MNVLATSSLKRIVVERAADYASELGFQVVYAARTLEPVDLIALSRGWRPRDHAGFNYLVHVSPYGDNLKEVRKAFIEMLDDLDCMGLRAEYWHFPLAYRSPNREVVV